MAPLCYFVEPKPSKKITTTEHRQGKINEIKYNKINWRDNLLTRYIIIAFFCHHVYMLANQKENFRVLLVHLLVSRRFELLMLPIYQTYLTSDFSNMSLNLWYWKYKTNTMSWLTTKYKTDTDPRHHTNTDIWTRQILKMTWYFF